MAKKNFAKGIDAFLDSTQEVSQSEKPKKPEKKEMIRTSISIEVDILEQLHAISFWERLSLQDVWKQALKAYINEKGEKYMNNAVKHYKERQSSNSPNS